MGYFSLTSLGDHMPVCVLPVLLDCYFLDYLIRGSIVLNQIVLECSQIDDWFYPMVPS